MSSLQEHKDRVKVCNDQTEPLRKRFDDDYGMYRLEKFTMGADEGRWDTFTTNKPSSEANKIIDYLAYSEKKLFIPMGDENKKMQRVLANTERLAIGAINLADELNENDPYSMDIQAVSAFYAVVRGWLARLTYLYKKDGKFIPKIQDWDIRNTYWISGENGLIWACYCRYSTKEQVEDEYPTWNGNTTVDPIFHTSSPNFAEIYNVWEIDDGKCKEGVFIGNDWVKEPEDTGLKYIPLRIRAGRSTPLIQDPTKVDTIKDMGESWLINNRDVFPAESRLMTYKITYAGIAAKAPTLGEYDSNKDSKPEKPETDPHQKGKFVWFDTGKGQKFLGQLVPQPSIIIDSTLNELVQLRNTGGLSDIVSGAPPFPLTAQGTDIISHFAMDVMKPPQRLMERTEKWTAEEVVRQYKNGDFGENMMEGYDKSSNRFRIKVKPTDIDDNWRFECKLVPDLLRDKNMNMGIASQGIQSGIFSRKTAMDVTQMVKDPQQEIENINSEQAEGVLNIGAVDKLISYIEEFSKSHEPRDLRRVQVATDALAQLTQPKGKGAPNVDGVPKSIQSGATASATNAPPEVPVPPEVREAMRGIQ